MLACETLFPTGTRSTFDPFALAWVFFYAKSLSRWQNREKPLLYL